jgi:hypothetical protein
MAYLHQVFTRQQLIDLGFSQAGFANLTKGSGARVPRQEGSA